MLKNKQRGQGMTEYIIIVALIAVSAIGVYSFFGQTIRNQVAGLSSEMSGQDANAQITAAQGSAADATTNADEDYNLGNYNEGADQGN
ncbi:Flp family type IVb pilin [Shewanella nanhaiensis]|uniref:Pilus assembly protein n=1 Tax=Shewanella nanhaiensis TaxID=2864872 RepID=A0ABS7E1A1_9GAMM|nr:pilus assembly protein [Shewanella nanhaiensis]MBW8183133.1 pilus assembly protein [Shewanella nanhaiensis]